MRMHFASKMLTICARMNLLIQMLASLAVLLQKALRVIAVVDRYNLLVASLQSLAFVAVIACIYPHLAGNRTSDGQLSLPIHCLSIVVFSTLANRIAATHSKAGFRA